MTSPPFCEKCILIYPFIYNYAIWLEILLLIEPVHDKTNKMTCAKQRLRSGWAYAHSDQSLCSLHKESLNP